MKTGQYAPAPKSSQPSVMRQTTPPEVATTSTPFSPPARGVRFSLRDISTSRKGAETPVRSRDEETLPGSPMQARTSKRAIPQVSQSGLPDPLRSRMERLAGLSLGDVQVYHNSPRPAEIQALAYTRGTQIHIGPGQERHLAHEAWHVVQQKQGRVKSTEQFNGLPVNTDARLEAEADRVAVHRPPMFAPGSPGPAEGGVNVIQGKFGFELELGVLLSRKISSEKGETAPIEPGLTKQEEKEEKEDENTYADPGLGKQDVIFQDQFITLAEDHASGGPRSDKGKQFELHQDLSNEDRQKGYRSRIGVVPPGTKAGENQHIEERSGGYTSILEIVTEAVDETVSQEEAVAPMVAAVRLANAIDGATRHLTRRVPLDAIIPNNRVPGLYLGYPGADQAQTLSANIQASYGLKLGAVPNALSMHAEATSEDDSYVIRETQARNAKLQKNLPLLAKTIVKEKPLSEADWSAIDGLLSLIGLYLFSGTSEARSGNLDKNLVPLLIRHPLSQSVNVLSEAARTFLSNEKVILLILRTYERGPDELLFKKRELRSYPGPISGGQDQPRCAAWISSVIRGEDGPDIFHFFEETRQIGPDTGKPTVPVNAVLEARSLRPPKGSGKEKMKEIEVGRFPPDAWVDLAKHYWTMLRKLNL